MMPALACNGDVAAYFSGVMAIGAATLAIPRRSSADFAPVSAGFFA
jgi:hypothetical protein